MSKKSRQSDQPYAYIDKAGKGEAPVTFTQLVKLVYSGALDADDKVKRHSDGEWQRVADADWLLYLPEPESGETSRVSPYASIEDWDNVKKKRGQSDASRNFWRLWHLAIFTIIWVFLFLMIYIGGGPHSYGPLTGFPLVLEMLAFLVVVGLGYAAIVYFGSGEFAEQSKARAYLENELTNWKSRRSNHICSVVDTAESKRVALEGFSIGPIKKSVFVYDAYDITVELQLVYPINSRVTTSHTFSVKWDIYRSKWQISPETDFKP